MNSSELRLEQLEDLEELAAYVDGLLPDDRCQAVEERLARDPGYYQIFTDTLRFQESEAGKAEGGETLHARFPFWRGVAAAAAAALTMAGALFLWTQRSPEPALVLASSLDVAALDQADPDWTDLGWLRFRGATTVTENLGKEPVALRLGTSMIHLATHLQASDLKRATIAAGEISNLSVSPHLEAARPILRRLYASLQDREPLDPMAVNAEIERLLPSPEMRPFYTAGTWLELARLAALTGNTDLLRRPALRDLLEDLAASGPSQDIQDRAAAAARILRSNDLDSEQLHQLLGHLGHLVTVLGDASQR